MSVELRQVNPYRSPWPEKTVASIVVALTATNPVVSIILPDTDSFPTNLAVSAYDYVSESEIAAEEQEEAAFLAFLDEQMRLYPKLVTPIDENQLDRIAKLVDKVEH